MKTSPLFLLLPLLAACPEDKLGELQVCRIEDYDPGTRACRSNAKDAPIQGAGAMCALRVKGVNGKFAKGEYKFLDDVVKTFGENVTTDEGVLAFAMTMDGMRQLPGGEWSCSITVDGETKQATFRSAGPTEQVLDLAVCPSVFTSDGPVGVCLADQAAQGFEQQQQVTCSATIVAARNQLVQAILRNQGSIVDISDGVRPDVELTVYAKRFAAPPNQVFAPGNYNCGILVDNQLVVDADFTMTAR